MADVTVTDCVLQSLLVTTCLFIPTLLIWKSSKYDKLAKSYGMDSGNSYLIAECIVSIIFLAVITSVR